MAISYLFDNSLFDSNGLLCMVLKVALLLEIGKGAMKSTAVSEVLASESRQMLAKSSATAPAHGLYLMSIDYDEGLFLDVPKASYGRLR